MIPQLLLRRALRPMLILTLSLTTAAFSQSPIWTTYTFPTYSAEDAANKVAQQATIAAQADSYGVGGMIVENSTGRVLCAYGNRVNGHLRSGEAFPLDPTNHGERQLVAWYYANRENLRRFLGYVPAPRQLTVVTSLDPCAMCAGSLLTAGFNVAVVAPDSSGGGVNVDGTGQFQHVPRPVQELLKSNFGYYRVIGSQARPVYQGGTNVIFWKQAISQAAYQTNIDVFDNSNADVQVIRGNTRNNSVSNPALLPGGDPVRQALTAAMPGAFGLTLTDTNETADVVRIFGTNFGKTYYTPTPELYALLRDANKSAPGSSNAMAIIDPFGNVLGIGVDKPSVSPIATCLMNAVQDYAAFYFNQVSATSGNPGDTNVFKTNTPFLYLPSTKQFTFVFLRALSPDLTTTLKDMGAFGSANGGLFEYIEPPLLGTLPAANERPKTLPVFYRYQADVNTLQSVPSNLILTVTSTNDSDAGSLRSAILAANASGHYNRIEFAVSGTLTLASDLPEIAVPISVDGTTAPGWSSGAPSFGIDAAGKRGLVLGANASGSDIQGLALTGSGSYGLESRTPSVSASENRFGVSVNGVTATNRSGSLSLTAGSATYARIPGWNSPLVDTNASSDINVPFYLPMTEPIVAVTRTDTNADVLSVSLTDSNGYPAPGLPSGGLLLASADPQALQPAMIENALSGVKGAERAWLHSEGKAQGGTLQVSNLAPGNWLPTATLQSNGTNLAPLDLVWVGFAGNSATAEFQVLPHRAQTNAALSPYVGRTYSVSLTFPTAGTLSRSQPGETAIQMLRLGREKISVGFYPVTDPSTGGVISGSTLLLPGQPGYSQAALDSANFAKLLLGPSQLPSYRTGKTMQFPGIDPSRSYGMVLAYLDGTGRIVSSYDTPQNGRRYQFQSFELAGGRVAVGIEVAVIGGNSGFNDLVITLPDQLRLGLR